MTTSQTRKELSLKLLAVAIAAAFGSVHAEEPDDITALTKPTSTVAIGGGFVSGDEKDRSLFSQYNGLREHDAFFLLDFDFLRRNDATGTWMSFYGRNLGLDSRELRAQWDRQGAWKIFGEYWELTRHYPRTINTSLEGSGSTSPIVTLLPAVGTGHDLDLKIDRKRSTVGAEWWFGKNWMVEASFINEDKDGARIFGRGFTCPSGAAPSPICTPLASGVNQWAILMLPEAIDSRSQQFEAKVNYLGEKLTVQAGYWGSFYDNHNGAMTATINGNLNNPLGHPMGQDGSVPLTAGLRNILQLPTALPPDNDAHQFYVSGTYGFSPTTRATFKYAYTRAEQKDDFLSNGLTGAPPGVSNYGGRVDTNLFQAGIVSRPWSKLTLNANYRYEDREDKSPLALYNIEGTNRFVNGTYSLKKNAGKVEASYLLPGSVRGTLGVDYEQLNRGQFESPECLQLENADCIGDSIAGITALRSETRELTYRGELRRSLTEDITGWIVLSHSDRQGDSWLKPAALPATGSVPVSDQEIFNRTGAFPIIFMDRKRDKVKAQAEWSPSEKLSLQFTLENGRDDYSAPTTKGLSTTEVKTAGIDATYAINDAWKASAYYTFNEQGVNVAHSSGYIIKYRDRNETMGLNVRGRVSPKLQMGADLLWINDRNTYDQTLDGSASATNVQFFAQSGGLPDVVWRDTRLNVYGLYALQKNADVRVDVIYDKQKLDEWTWNTFVYSDNTTVTLKPDQNVTFVGVRYIYRFK